MSRGCCSKLPQGRAPSTQAKGCAIIFGDIPARDPRLEAETRNRESVVLLFPSAPHGRTHESGRADGIVLGPRLDGRVCVDRHANLWLVNFVCAREAQPRRQLKWTTGT